MRKVCNNVFIDRSSLLVKIYYCHNDVGHEGPHEAYPNMVWSE